MRMRTWLVLCWGLAWLGGEVAAEAVELRVVNATDLGNCVSGVALTAGPDAGKVPAPGDTCVLNPGTYAGPFTITLPNLTLQSRDGKFTTTITGGLTVAATANGVTIGGPGGNQGVTISGAGLVVLALQDFTLQNSDVMNAPGVGIAVAGGGLVRNFQFLNLEVRGHGGHGLAFTNGGAVTDVTINDALFQNNAGSHIFFANGGEVGRLSVRGATLRSAGGSGVAFSGSVTDVRDSDFSNSQIEGNAANGVVFANAGRVQGVAFSGVRCNGNAGGNVAFANGSDVAGLLVESSTFNRSSTAFGMGFLNGGGVESLRVRDSEFDQNFTVGFGVGTLPDDFANSSFERNRFRNNGTLGLAAFMTTSSIKDLDFADNDFSQNNGAGALFVTTMGDIAGFRFDGDAFTKNGALGLRVNAGDPNGLVGGPVAGAGDIGEFTFENVTASENGAMPGTGIELLSSDGDIVNVALSGSTVSNNGGPGFQAASTGAGGTTPGEVSRVTIQNSRLESNGTRAAAGLGSGLQLAGRKVSAVALSQTSASSNNDHGADLSGTDSISAVSIQDGQFDRNDRNQDSIGDGVHLNTGASGTASDVTVDGVSADGNASGIAITVQGRNGSNLVVQNSQASGNRDAGIRVAGSEDLNDVSIVNNTAEGNAFNVDVSVTVRGSNIVIENNRLKGASGTGIFLNATGVSVQRNDIRGHTIGVKAKKATDNHVNQNNIVQNSQFGVDGRDLGPGQRLDATNNWWGEPSGPSGAGPGIGDAVSSKVNFIPFLTAPAVTTGANFQISNLTAPAQAQPGDTVTIEATVQNAGSDEGTQTIVLRVTAPDGSVVKEETRTIPLNPAASTQISVQVVLSQEGLYTVEVRTPNDTATRTIAVGSGAPPPGSSIAQALDANGNNRLDDAEILRAIQLWIGGDPVPGTGGRTIDDAEILRLIQLWISGDPIA